MTINWIKCSERMPVDDGTIYITKYPPGGFIRLTGEVIHELTENINIDVEWIPYTEQAWKELNK